MCRTKGALGKKTVEANKAKENKPVEAEVEAEVEEQELEGD